MPFKVVSEVTEGTIHSVTAPQPAYLEDEARVQAVTSSANISFLPNQVIETATETATAYVGSGCESCILNISEHAMHSDVLSHEVSHKDFDSISEKKKSTLKLKCLKSVVLSEGVTCANSRPVGASVPPTSFVQDFSDEDDLTDCLICLEPFDEEQFVTILPCRHMFHHSCISTWLSSRLYQNKAGKCPHCNLEIVAPKVEKDPLPHLADELREAQARNTLEALRGIVRR